ncbi:CpaF family protein [Streptacidiphilus neutrinimicus]|uniref:CpaF family protein n=1 Tax=Streptacidiphilus neutrinimicus TaxID=105420 RepID=UPI0005AA2829|nr:ATPase, T2SS/T4P/T4SS family [Streptacidiphilus neutrinimicus]
MSVTDEAARTLATEFRTRIGRQLVAAEQQAGSRGLTSEARWALAEQLLQQELRQDAVARLRRAESPLDEETEARVCDEVRAGMTVLGTLGDLLADSEVEDILVNDLEHVFVHYAGSRRERLDRQAADSVEALTEMVRQVAVSCGAEERRFDRASPFLSAQLPDGSRLFAAFDAHGTPTLSIRRHRLRTATLEDLVGLGMMNRELAEELRLMVRARLSMLFAGGPGVGKTTVMSACLNETDPSERIITIEDTLELNLHRNGRHRNVVPLQAREANLEGVGEITQAELVRWSLRMSPDRVIVGECRGPEVVAMLNAFSVGNEGSMSSIHAATSRGAFMKLAAYAAQGPEKLTVEATNQLIASSLHVVVQLSRATDGTRVVSSVREIIDADGVQIISNELWEPGPDRRARRAAPPSPHLRELLDQLLPGYGR